jgi:hypothetical protein
MVIGNACTHTPHHWRLLDLGGAKLKITKDGKVNFI